MWNVDRASNPSRPPTVCCNNSNGGDETEHMLQQNEYGLPYMLPVIFLFNRHTG